MASEKPICKPELSPTLQPTRQEKASSPKLPPDLHTGTEVNMYTHTNTHVHAPTQVHTHTSCLSKNKVLEGLGFGISRTILEATVLVQRYGVGVT